MKRESASVLVALCLAAAAIPFDASHAAAQRHNESRNYAALAKWPDWSGGWNAFFGPLELKQVLDKSLKPDARAEFNEIFRRYTSAELNLRELYCASYLFGGFSEGAEGDIEFLFSPDRVTLIWEGGLVRRIYLNSYAAAKEDPETGGSGVSTGHWEGSTLVVSTELNPNAGPLLGYLNTSSFRVGDHAHLTERIHLKDANTLQMDMVLEAPALLSSPAKLTVLYRRDHDYRMSDYTRCPKQDRSIDDESGHLKHDHTPPADLPPPPR
jgi:hypothetical protein